jgi:16S rRNA pseudouridine516 synthase
MRLDKYLADMNIGSRKEAKGYIKKGLVAVNGTIVKSDKFQVKENDDVVTFDGDLLAYQADFYYILNKLAGVISATVDNVDSTVLDLFSEEAFRDDLFPVGRLDKDTEGLLIITNDGKLAHNLLSPKRHVDKEYFAEVAGIMTQADVQKFAKGIVIDGDEQTMPAELTIVSKNEAAATSTIKLILHEGKFHQVKRMVHAVGKEVTYLERIRMGNLSLPADLARGEYRELTALELLQLQEKNK